jgi:hypothetical protein
MAMFDYLLNKVLLKVTLLALPFILTIEIGLFSVEGYVIF